MTAEPIDVALGLIRHLRSREIPCAIGGSIALALWGMPRFTKDVDLNCFVSAERFEALLDVLVAGGCEGFLGTPWTPEARAEFVRRARDGEVAVCWKDGYRIDIFVPSIPFYADAEASVRVVVLEGEQVPVLSPETLCVFKLLFFRARDLTDIERIVARQLLQLDLSWVRRHIVDMVGESDERVTAWDAIVRDHAPTSPPPS